MAFNYKLYKAVYSWVVYDRLISCVKLFSFLPKYCLFSLIIAYITLNYVFSFQLYIEIDLKNRLLFKILLSNLQKWTIGTLRHGVNA